MFVIILYAHRVSNHIENVNIKVVNNEKDAIKELVQDPNYYNDITTILLEMENESINTDIDNKIEQLCNIYRENGLDELDEDDPKLLKNMKIRLSKFLQNFVILLLLKYNH